MAIGGDAAGEAAPDDDGEDRKACIPDLGSI